MDSLSAAARPSFAECAQMASKSSRSKCLATSLQKPSSSSMINMHGFRLGINGTRYLNYSQKEPKLPDSRCKLVIVNRLCDINAAAKVVATLNFSLIVRCCQDDYRCTL